MALTVHHFNCGTFRPLGGRLIDGKGSFTHAATLVCHCLLVELPDALVLIDTGIGLADIADPAQRLGQDFLRRVRPVLERSETAVQQVTRLGYDLQDVRHIVLTHLDRDHAGGLADFPDAEVHVHQPALQAALHPATQRDQDRHRSGQWAHGPKWQPHPTDGEQWFGFEAVHVLAGLPDDLLLVPLAGHSTGHAGVAVRSDATAGTEWLLHAGDAYFFHGETDPGSPHCPPGLRFFQRKAQADQQVRLDNQQRLRELRAAGAVTVFSAHDPVEFGALSAR